MSDYSPEQLALVKKQLEDPVFFAREVLGVEPWSKQVEILRAVQFNKRVAIRSGHKVAKALDINTEIPTPHGFAAMGALAPGDIVYDGNGEETEITAVTPWMYDHSCYRVVFDDGTEIIADEGHLWNVQTHRSRKNHERKGLPVPLEVMTTKELLDGGVVTAHAGRNYAVPVVGIRGSKSSLPIAPYTLGTWLGDGTSSSGHITNADQEVWDGIEAEGYAFTPYRGGKGKAETRCIVGLNTALRELNVKRNKYIPYEYLTASREDRLALLRGLMDTDGHCAPNGTCFFSGTNPSLVRDVRSLVSSLGFKSSLHDYAAKIGDKYCGQAWRVTFTPQECVFTIKRKAERQHTGKTKHQWTKRRYIKSIEPVQSVPVCCISVASPTHTFLATRSFIQTHNSHSLAILALWWAWTKTDARVAITSASFSQVDKILWREITKMYRQAKLNLGGQLYRDPASGLIFDNYNEIFGFSTDQPERAAGISSPNLLYLIDEASGVPDELFEAMEGNRAAGATIVMTSNPTKMVGTYFDAFHSKRNFWKTIHISSRQSPNVTGERTIPGLATAEWIREKEAEWGVTSPIFQVRIEGNFPGQGSNSVIGLSLVEEAKDRYPRTPAGGVLRIGVDPARYGDDETVIYPVRGLRALTPVILRNLPGDKIAGNVLNIIEKLRGPNDDEIRVKVDVVGLGASPVDFLSIMERAKSMGVVVRAVNVSDAADEADKYADLRTQVCYGLKKWLELGGAIPDDDLLVQELVSATYDFDARGRIRLSSKKDERKLMGRSPDRRNALELALYEPKPRRTIGAAFIDL